MNKASGTGKLLTLFYLLIVSVLRIVLFVRGKIPIIRRPRDHNIGIF